MDRTKQTVTTLRTPADDNGGMYTARIQGDFLTVDMQTVETFASLRLPLTALAGFEAFLTAVRADPAAAVAESSEPVVEPGQEEFPNG